MSATYRRRLLVIYNPTAGAGQLGRRKRVRLEAYLDLLEDAGCAVEFRPTTRRGDAEAFAGDGHATQYDAVVAAGGDGTIGEVANVLPLDSAPLGIFALGTANVLAMETGLPLDQAAVLQAVPHAPVAQVWPGLVTDRLFNNIAGRRRHHRRGRQRPAAGFGAARHLPAWPRQRAGDGNRPAARSGRRHAGRATWSRRPGLAGLRQ